MRTARCRAVLPTYGQPLQLAVQRASRPSAECMRLHSLSLSEMPWLNLLDFFFVWVLLNIMGVVTTYAWAFDNIAGFW